jgi:hypothetical protein
MGAGDSALTSLIVCWNWANDEMSPEESNRTALLVNP